MDKNAHIKKYLNYYISIDNPEFAVLLRGKWGAGKSWFIKAYMEDSEKYLYVSLNGVGFTKEIEDSFFEQLHPKLSSHGMKIAGKILTGILKSTLRIDIDGKDGNNSINFKSPDIDIKKFNKNANDKIIVFDDLERCSMDLKGILGYINQLVEVYGMKVIILANENELKQDVYAPIKEKLIGVSFDIKSNFHDAVQSFINQITVQKAKELLNEKIDILSNIYESGGYENLRHIRQIIHEFNRFYKFLPKKAIDHKELIDHIISLFFLISIEIKKGAINEDEIVKLFQTDYSSLMNSNVESKKPTEIQKIRRKYSIINYYHHPITSYLWTQFFKTGTLNIDELDESINNSYYFIEEKKADWVKLWYYWELDEEDFETLKNKVFSDFEGQKIENILVLIHVFAIFLQLSKMSLVKESSKKIIGIVKKNVIRLKKERKFQLDIEYFDPQGALGMGFIGKENPEFQTFISYVLNMAKSSQTEDYPKLAKELLELMTIDIQLFQNCLIHSNYNISQYFKIPILNHIKVADFVETLFKLKNKDKNTIGKILLQRYRHNEFNISLKEESQWLESVSKEIEAKKSKLKIGITKANLEKGILEDISAAIKSINN